MKSLKLKLVLGGLLLACGLCGCSADEKSGENMNTVQSESTENGNPEDGSSSKGDFLESSFLEESEWTDEQRLQNFSYMLLAEQLEEENPVLSPMSAYFAVSLAATGAQGETQQEMQSILGKDLLELPQSLIQSMIREDGENITVRIANSAWIDDSMNVEDKWMQDAEQYYVAEAVHTDLADEKTMKAINTWVDENTGGLIKEFLNAPFSEDTRLALFNTIYFNAKWKLAFEPDSTRKREFTTTSGNVEEVDMMQMSMENQEYFSSELGQGVLLPYRDGTYSFVAMKPAEGMTVREMYDKLTMDEMISLIDGRKSCLVNLRLPKFEVNFDRKLNDSFMNMGMMRAFDTDLAEFQGIGYTENGLPLYIDLIRQKAVLRVDEEGTEAAAVTMVVMNDCMAMMPEEEPVELYFDEPFFYMIWDNGNQVPLFMGIMDDPALAQVK